MIFHHIKEVYKKNSIESVESYIGYDGLIYLIVNKYSNGLELIKDGFTEIEQLYTNKTFLKIISIDEMKTIYKNSKNKKLPPIV
jgi:hypothetical protein